MIITDDLELNDNFTFNVVKVNYDWVNNTVSVEIIFKEGLYAHHRTFEYKATNGMTEQDVIDLLKAESWYKY